MKTTLTIQCDGHEFVFALIDGQLCRSDGLTWHPCELPESPEPILPDEDSHLVVQAYVATLLATYEQGRTGVENV